MRTRVVRLAVAGAVAGLFLGCTIFVEDTTTRVRVSNELTDIEVTYGAGLKVSFDEGDLVGVSGGDVSWSTIAAGTTSAYQITNHTAAIAISVQSVQAGSVKLTGLEPIEFDVSEGNDNTLPYDEVSLATALAKRGIAVARK